MRERKESVAGASKDSHSLGNTTATTSAPSTASTSKYFKKKNSTPQPLTPVLQRDARGASREKSRTPGRDIIHQSSTATAAAASAAAAATAAANASASKWLNSMTASGTSSSSLAKHSAGTALAVQHRHRPHVITDADEDDNSSSGSSSEDQPLCVRNGDSTLAPKFAASTVITPAASLSTSPQPTSSPLDASTTNSLLQPAVGTKRKAEVLSKESGKIGVTIKTSSPEQPPPAKIPCTNPTASSTSAVSISATGNSNKTASGSSGATVKPIVHAPETAKSSHLHHQGAPLSPETPASRPESDTPSASTSHKIQQQPPHGVASVQHQLPNKPAFNIAANKARAAANQQQSNTSSAGSAGIGNNVNVLKDISHIATTGDAVALSASSNTSLPLPVSPRTAPPRLWLPKAAARKAEQVFITDVTVNLETVTIRECKTEQGFFRDRPLNDPQQHDQQLTH